MKIPLQLAALAVLAAAGHEVVHEAEEVKIKGLTGRIMKEKISPFYATDKKSKGEKKRQRSEWNNSIYNNRKGLQRG